MIEIINELLLRAVRLCGWYGYIHSHITSTAIGVIFLLHVSVNHGTLVYDQERGGFTPERSYRRAHPLANPQTISIPHFYAGGERC